MNEFNIKKALENINVNADWIGLREVKEVATYRVVRDHNPVSNHKSESHGIMVEILKNGQFGYCGINKFDTRSLQFAVEQALTQAEKASAHSLYKFSEEARPKSNGRYLSEYIKGSNSVSPGELNDLLVKANKELKVSDKIVSVSAFGIITETEFNYVSTNGSEVNQNFLMVTTDFSANAQDGNVLQRRTGGRTGNQIGMEVFEEDRVLSLCNTIGEQAVELLTAEECPSGKFDLVLTPDQMMLQIHESIGHALEIDRILGDERNYAGWSFVRLDDFGKLKYGSDLLNITFDPSVKSELASYGFDDGGLKAEKEYIIKEGLLLRGLGGKESQIRSKVPGVANFRASSWNRAPIDRMANLNLESGNSSYDEIISSVENGVLMETNRSWSIDDYRNKFQFGCEYGKIIKDGKLTKTIKNPNYRGVSTPFWNNLSMVGNESTFEVHGTPNCGKGEPNQVIRVGHASPLCKFNDIEIFGGA